MSRYETKEYKEELKYKVKMRKIEERGQRKLRKQELKAKRDSYKIPKKKMQTTKIIIAFLMIFLLINCVGVELYSAYVMFVLRDLSALYVLIGAACTTVIGEVLSFSVYACKSYMETREEAKINLEYKKLESNLSFQDDESVG